jgi:hypothetical protein
MSARCVACTLLVQLCEIFKQLSLPRLKLASPVAKFVALFVIPERRISPKPYEEAGHSRFLIFAISSADIWSERAS